MFINTKSHFSENYKEQRQQSITAAEYRINKDLHEMKQYRITTKLFQVKMSNIFKDYFNEKLTMLVAMESINSMKNYEVLTIFI